MLDGTPEYVQFFILFFFCLSLFFLVLHLILWQLTDFLNFLETIMTKFHKAWTEIPGSFFSFPFFLSFLSKMGCPDVTDF